MTEESKKTEYFDLITTGLGYLNRSREVKPNQGSPYESVSIAALHGRADCPSYSYLDCGVVGADAIDFVKTHRDAINDRDTKVLVRFNVGDGDAHSYDLPAKRDQPAVRRHIIKGRLLKITWAKVGDEVVTQESHEAASVQQAETTTTDGDESWEDSLGDIVALSKDDPDFLRKRSLLKERGYRWNNVNHEWMLKAA